MEEKQVVSDNQLNVLKAPLVSNLSEKDFSMKEKRLDHIKSSILFISWTSSRYSLIKGHSRRKHLNELAYVRRGKVFQRFAATPQHRRCLLEP
ncbi:hypothetical protein RUM44_002434 [Polyplax serrata]|uniref:Uncharacterized protein n=1 Tax=Polyplax serrata TaxID=468196 RepID=A0ABR1AES6_POLSC